MIRYAITYRRPVCPKCHSRMVTHVEQGGDCRYGCSMCKTELPASVIEQVEAEEWRQPIQLKESIKKKKKHD